MATTSTPISIGESDVPPLSSKEVEKLHKNADTDAKPTAAHHTIGPGQMQASPGNHSHDGGTSQELAGIDITNLVNTSTNQYISGQKQFASPIVGSFSSVPTNESDMMDAKISAATGGLKTTGGQIYVGNIATGNYLNATVYPGLSGLYSITVTPYGTSRITPAVLSQSGYSCTLQAQNWSGGTASGVYLNWIAVGY